MEKRFGITGMPVAHSQSPALFQAAYHGKYSYELLPASTSEEALQLFREKGLSGMNVTMPLKTSIVGLIDVLSDEAKWLQSVNTIRLINGKLYGNNTDIEGVLGALIEAGVEVNRSSCLVLGAGGAGRAAAYALDNAGTSVAMANRSTTWVEATPRLFRVDALSLDEAVQLSRAYRVIVNTLPAGTGIAQRLPLHSRQILLDADYVNKPMLEACRQAGTKYIDGLRWLVHQAIPAYRLFTDEAPDREAMTQLWKR
ncbi:MAG: hypothetical protein LBT48_02245 [Prevotellaceae bacterium]|jgi:shikimate dehydrogenase|nr:hypothetical protein [Prevotellaceae bacterium]